jgi:hypothetical protein
VETRRARLADAAEMAPFMREEDAAEVLAEAGHTPYEALAYALALSGSQAWTVRVDKKIMAMWGVVPVDLLSGVGVPWLLTTYEVERHPKIFMRASREAVRWIRKRYNFAFNRIDARYEKALRWAKRIGFETFGPETADGYTFHAIVLRGD